MILDNNPCAASHVQESALLFCHLCQIHPIVFLPCLAGRSILRRPTDGMARAHYSGQLRPNRCGHIDPNFGPRRGDLKETYTVILCRQKNKEQDQDESSGKKSHDNNHKR
jgi:hypothetical protein